MRTRLRALIDCLHGQHIQPTGEEIADVLWLALRMGEPTKTPSKLKRHDQGHEAPESTEPTPGQPPAPPPGQGPNVPPPAETQLPLYAESATPTPPPVDQPLTGARPFRTPAVPALPDSLALSRALRPLIRKIPSRGRRILDETATAERYADRKVWLPVFKGRPERWLELALVMDGSPALRLWRHTVVDLYRLLAQHGAFRDVRLWQLGTDATGQPLLTKGLDASTSTSPQGIGTSGGGSAVQLRRPEELLDAEGRRIVILISDYANPPWYQGLYDPWLRLWGQHQPLALLHLLPPRFWMRGGLHRGELVQFQLLAPGQPNTQLVADSGPTPPDALALPLFTLESESVRLWAQVLAGYGEAPCPGVILPAHAPTAPPPRDARPDAQQRLRRFRQSASPDAQTLARYCATIPLTLPVMRLLQVELLPHSRPVHLAEVFFSGLLWRKNPEETDPDQFLYDFHHPLRENLLDTLRAPQLLAVHQRLSEAVRRNFGKSADFIAFIPELLNKDGMQLDLRSLPFAEVGVTILQRLGDAYLERAERLARDIKQWKIRTMPMADADEKGANQELEEERVDIRQPTPFRDRLHDGKTEGPEMVWLPGDTFMMGDDNSGFDNEKPAHPVTLTHFGIGKYPVTFEEYDAFCQATGRKKPDDASWGRERRPVINVSWGDAVAYCEWLSQQTGARYRLLTEAEWEYACRAGKKILYHFGDDEQQLDDYAWYSKNARRKTHTVGKKQPNEWYLHDMHGNVWEWVHDWFGHYSKQTTVNPKGPKRGYYRVIRGGGWSYAAGYCRSTSRRRYLLGHSDNEIGFRLARDGTWPSDTFTLARQQAAETATQQPTDAKREQYQPYEVFHDGPDGPAMVYLPGGIFKVGDIQGNGLDWERPVHEVTLDAFAIGRYPITVGEFRRFVEATGYQTEAEQQGGASVYDSKRWGRKADANWRNPYFQQSKDHPVVCISWNDAVEYCQWLSKETGEDYALPTEAEWEYACRADSETAYCFGDHEQPLEDYVWYSKNAVGRTHPIGEKQSNHWGIYDMHGHVWEWVRDWYGFYSKEPQHNPSGPESGSDRVNRGGSWNRDADGCRSAYRFWFDPGDRSNVLGFRLARRV